MYFFLINYMFKQNKQKLKIKYEQNVSEKKNVLKFAPTMNVFIIFYNKLIKK